MRPTPGSPAARPRCVIIGGGVIGAATACFLVHHPRFAGEVTVVERDPTYQQASTPRSAGGIRHQFSTPVNVAASLFATEFVRHPSRFLPVPADTALPGLVEQGYLMLASEAGAGRLAENVARQNALGARVEALDPAALRRRFAWLRADDLALAAFGHGEGWTDPHALLMLFRDTARAGGAHFVHDQVVGLCRRGDRLHRAALASGASLSAEVFVNAAGPAAASICAMAQATPLPVSCRKRMVFVFHCREALPRCPLVVDPAGVYFRPEGEQFLCGRSPSPEADPECDDLVVDHHWFEEAIWPLLAHRVPAFEAIRVRSAWAGHYAVNTFDHNALVGRHHEVENLYLANGFSGHGLQQSPAVGRGLAELIVDGEYTSLDLSAFSPLRIADGQPLVEGNIV